MGTTEITHPRKGVVMSTRFCFSCGMPLEAAGQGGTGEYCGYCTTSDGTLKPRQEVQNGIAGWMKMWQPEIDEAKASIRAESYMKAMPAWADN
jgi:hypothetical protein